MMKVMRPPQPALGARVTEVLTVRGMLPSHLDRAVAKIAGKTAKTAGTSLTAEVTREGRNPRADTLLMIAEALNVSPCWLLTGDGAMSRESQAIATYESLPGWPEAANEERKRERLAPWFIRAAGRSPVMVTPREVTPDLVFQVASFWLATAAVKECDAALATAADEERDAAARVP